MKGRNGSTSFLPLNKKGGLFKNVSLEKYLMEDQTKYVYDQIELGDKIKVRKVSQEIQNKTLPHKRLKEKEEMNLYEKVLVSDVNTLDKNSSHIHRKMCKKMGKEEGQIINIDFGESPEVLKAKYMDVYEDVFAEVVTTNRL